MLEPKEFKIKLTEIDPLGCTTNEVKTSMIIEESKEAMRHPRYLLEIGDYTYFIRKNGEIVDTLISPVKKMNSYGRKKI